MAGVGEGAGQARSPNPYCFIVGAARSGTTLLQRVVDAHPELAVVNETYWLIPRAGGPKQDLSREMTPSLVAEMLSRPKFAKMGLAAEEVRELLAAHPGITHPMFIEKVFDLYARGRGKPFAGDKTPGYVRKLDRLHTLWPHARFLHIIRDPRDLTLSMVSWKSGPKTAGRFGVWSQDPVATTALYWRHCVLMGRQSGARIGAAYQEVRYEALVNSFEETCDGICAFFGLPFDRAMLSFHEGRSHVGASSKERWLPPTPGLRDWRSQMDPGDAEACEAACGDVLDQLGYPRAYPRPSAGAQARAAAAKEAFNAQARAASRRFPDGW